MAGFAVASQNSKSIQGVLPESSTRGLLLEFMTSEIIHYTGKTCDQFPHCHLGDEKEIKLEWLSCMSSFLSFSLCFDLKSKCMLVTI